METEKIGKRAAASVHDKHVYQKKAVFLPRRTNVVQLSGHGIQTLIPICRPRNQVERSQLLSVERTT